MSYAEQNTQRYETPPTGIRNTGLRKKRKYVEEPLTRADEILKTVGEKLSTPEDEFTIIGKNVAAKLRRMPRETKIYTEKLINDLLFQAELGKIDQYATISIVNASTYNTLLPFNHSQSNTPASDNNLSFPSCPVQNSSTDNYYPNTNWTSSGSFSSFEPTT